jgi:hypothetical protein
VVVVVVVVVPPRLTTSVWWCVARCGSTHVCFDSAALVCLGPSLLSLTPQDLLDGWQATLEKHRAEFLDEAQTGSGCVHVMRARSLLCADVLCGVRACVCASRAVMRWDREIMKNQQALTSLTHEISELKVRSCGVCLCVGRRGCVWRHAVNPCWNRCRPHSGSLTATWPRWGSVKAMCLTCSRCVSTQMLCVLALVM